MDTRTVAHALVAYATKEAEGKVRRWKLEHTTLDEPYERRGERVWEIAWDSVAAGPGGRGVWVRIKCVHGDLYVCGLYALRSLADEAGTIERSGVLV